MKMELRNIRFMLTKVCFNWKHSGQGDNEDDQTEERDRIRNLYASNFNEFLLGRYGRV